MSSNIIPHHFIKLHVQLAAYIAAVVVSLFDADILANLPAALLPFRQLADEQYVHRALLWLFCHARLCRPKPPVVNVWTAKSEDAKEDCTTK